MPLRNSKDRWGDVSIGLHWLMVLLIFSLFLLGWMATSWHLSPLKFKLFVWHKSFGMLVLGLLMLRILWRFVNIRPAWPTAMSFLERTLASTVHVILYSLMIAMPLSGWLISSAADIPFKMFWLIPIPNLVPADKSVQTLAETLHLTFFWVFAAALLAHIVAALKHHFMDKDQVLLGMLPKGKQQINLRKKNDH